MTKPHDSRPVEQRPAWRRYGLALIVSGAATVLRALDGPLASTELPYILFMPVLALVTAWSGRGPGLFATFLLGLAGNYFFMTPPFDWSTHSTGIIGLLLFWGSGGLIAHGTAALVQARERERAVARALEEERRRAEGLIASVPGVVWEAWGRPDSARQRVDYVSAEVERMLGYSVEEWLATPNFWLTIVHRDDRERAAREAAAIFESRGHGFSEFRWLRRDGRVIWAHAQSVVILDHTGKPIGMRGVTLDVTALKQAEKSIRVLTALSESFSEAELRFGDLAQRVAVAGTELLGECCVLRVFQGEELQRVGLHHVDPAKVPLVTRLADSAGVGDTLTREVAQSRKLRAMTLPIESVLRVTPDEAKPLVEQVFAPELLIAPVVAHDRVLGCMTILRRAPAYSVAEQRIAEALAGRAALALSNARLYEEARSANGAKDEFLAMLGHELRNPLAPILTALHVLELRGEVQGRRELSIIKRQVTHLVSLVDDLLDVSRIVRGKIELDKKPVELSAVVRQGAEMAGPLIEQRRHELEVRVPESGLPLHADSTRLSQVVSNLLTNAAKYTEPGGKITLTAARDGDQVRLSVSDTGIGLEPAALAMIFEPFVQERQALDRGQGGLGLGLAIVRSMVELHGGSVSATSAGRGRGSTFTVRLPAAEPYTAVSEPPPARLGAGEDVKGAVLVVDDNQDAAEMLAQALSDLGYAVRVAHDGPEALRTLGDFTPRFALLDIGLPVMDGYQLAREVHARRPDCTLVAVTGYGQAGDRERAWQAGFAEYVVKPVDPSRLDALLKERAARQVHAEMPSAR